MGAYDSDMAGNEFAAPTIKAKEEIPINQIPIDDVLDTRNNSKIEPGNISTETAQYRASVANSFTPDVQPSIDRTKGFSSQASAPVKQPFTPDVHVSKQARPATDDDVRNLDESNIMAMPFIQAKSFDIPAMLQVKPRDAAIRFRWVNFKNHEGGNYSMFKAIGFVNAKPDDVQGTLGEHFKTEDGSIKFYDVVLMKINVFRLLSAYKANVQKSLERVGRWDKTALTEAKRSFNNDCSADMLKAMKEAGLSVDFYVPSRTELEKDDKNFLI